MTMDNDPGHFNITSPRKSFNPFDSDDETLGMPDLETENVYAKEDDIGFDLKEFEKSANPLTFLMDNDDTLWEEAELDESALISTANGQPYTDKNVTESELPEIIHQSVKDIAVDEGADIHDKILVQKSEDEIKVSADLQDLSIKGENDESNQDVLSGQDTVHESAMVDSLTDRKLDVENDLVGKDGADNDAMFEKKGNDNSLVKVESTLVQELATGETLSKISSEHEETELNPDKIMPISSENTVNSMTNSEPRKQEDNPESSEAAKQPSTESTTTHEQPTSSNSVSTGFPVHTPSSITFSGPVSYSGSVSIRSESSAASTRSFAFPVLQTDWNSSPVRMAKADRRHGKKHRGWMQAVICCRF